MEKVCSQCGAPLEEGATRCRYCNSIVAEAKVTAKPVQYIDITKTTETSSPMVNGESRPVQVQNEAQAGKMYGILAYLGFLVFIPIFAAPGSRFVRFHANQGLTLFLAEVILGFARRFLYMIPFMGIIASAASMGLLILAVLGIIAVSQGEEKPLPLIGEVHLLK